VAATNLEGKTQSDATKPCEGEWKFDEHKKGSWDGKDANGNKALYVGIVAKLSFTLPPNCCNCKEIKLLQTARTLSKAVGGTDWTYDGGPRGNAFDTPLDATKGIDKGWHVDQPSERAGWYGGYKATREFGGQPEDLSGSGKLTAWLKDWPSSTWAELKNGYVGRYKYLETCAVCADGVDKGKVLSCVTWQYGLTIDAKKNTFGFVNIKWGRTVSPSASFVKAVELWNKEAAKAGSAVDALPSLK